jgi:hypothetical protein
MKERIRIITGKLLDDETLKKLEESYKWRMDSKNYNRIITSPDI